MKSYNLDWDKKINDIISSYTESKKVYIDNIEYLKILFKKNISDDDYLLYEYNSKVKFLIKDIIVKDDKIDHMIVYLLSNDSKELNNLYSKIRDNISNDKNDNIINYIQYQKGEKESYFFNDSIGIIKNYESCMHNKKFYMSDLHTLNEITKLEFKNEICYLGGNKYLNIEEYKKYVDKYFNIQDLYDKKLYAVITHIGKYDKIYKSYNKLLNNINAANKKIVGLPMEQFVCGSWNELDKNKYITNIMIPIE